MPKWKKAMGAVLAAGLALSCFTAGTLAAGTLEKVEAFLRKDYKVMINGEAQNLALPPLIYQDRTYLPLYEIAKQLDSDVVWEGETKTIYINQRVFTLQPSVEDDPDSEQQDYDEIEQLYFSGQIARYLGRDYPVLMMIGWDGKTYYRVRDLERMGIDVRPLNKVREILTDTLYVSEAEASAAWKTTPEWSYPYPYSAIITGETDSEKIEALTSFQPMELIPGDHDEGSQLRPISGDAIVIDKLTSSDHTYPTYLMLYNARGELWQYELTLMNREKDEFVDGKFQKVTEWYVGAVNSEKLSKN